MDLPPMDRSHPRRIANAFARATATSDALLLDLGQRLAAVGDGW